MACSREGCSKKSFRLVPFAGFCSPKCKREHIASGKFVVKDTFSAKLTAEQVSFIKRRLKEGDTGVSLAKMFNVSSANICSINAGRIWTHVTQDIE